MTKDEIILAQQARIEQLLSVVEDLSGLIDESSGVYGLHLNGDPSPWEELLPGGRFERITNFYEALATQDNLSALRAHDAKLLAPYQWQPIETAPKGELIAIWIVGTNKNGQKWSDEEGECWLYCYHDNICGDWRTTRPSGHLRCVPDRFVTHWMPLPSAEAIEKGGV